MKKIFATILAVFLLFNLLNPISAYAKENPSLSVSSKNAGAGDEVEVNVSIANNPGILGGTFKLSYDSRLTLKAANAGEAFAALTMTKPGKLEPDCRFVWDGTDLEDKDVKDGTILTLTFEVPSDAKAKDIFDIELSCVEAINRELSAVSIETGNGSISVPEQGHQPDVATLSSISAVKTKTSYDVDDSLNLDDISVTAYYSDETNKSVTSYTTNASEINMSIAGEKTLIITYTENEVTKTCNILIQVNAKEIDTDKTTISVDSNIALPGDQIDINVNIKNNPGIIGCVLKLQYDEGLTLKDAKLGDAFEKLTMTKPGVFVNGCNFIWDATDLKDADIKDGTILTLTFEISNNAKKDDKYNISFSCTEAIDRNITPVDVKLQNGVVTVGDSSMIVKNELTSIEAKKTKVKYDEGDTLNVDDIVVTALYKGGIRRNVTGFTTNATQVDMSTAGTKKLVISYTEEGIKKEAEISIEVIKKDDNPSGGNQNPAEKPTDNPKPQPEPKPVTPTPAPQPKATPGIGTISTDGKTLVDTDGVKYLVAEKLTKAEIKKNVQVADKKSGGKYKITKITKKGGKVTGGTVTYMAPYNKNCKKATAGATVKLGGVSFKITAINKNAFKNCKNIATMTIGGNVTQIGANAFSGCSKLKTITIKGKSLKKIGGKAFNGINAKAKFKLDKATYKNTKLLKKYTKMIQGAKAPKGCKITK